MVAVPHSIEIIGVSMLPVAWSVLLRMTSMHCPKEKVITIARYLKPISYIAGSEVKSPI